MKDKQFEMIMNDFGIVNSIIWKLEEKLDTSLAELRTSVEELKKSDRDIMNHINTSVEELKKNDHELANYIINGVQRTIDSHLKEYHKEQEVVT